MLLFPDGDEDKQVIGMMRVWGHFDASGTHKNLDRLGRPSPAVAVSGYLATPKQWKYFDEEWRIVLDYAGIPFFHMTEFVARVGFYEGWTEEKRKLVIEALIAVINRNVLYGIGALVLLEDYKEVVATQRHWQVLGQPYTFCSKMCFYAAAMWADKYGYKDSIRYIFDQGDEHKHEVLTAHTAACGDEETSAFYRFGHGSLTFDRKDKVRPIQAADILAYEMYREMQRNVYRGESKTYTRKSLGALLDTPGDYKVYGKSGLMGVIHQAEELYGDVA